MLLFLNRYMSFLTFGYLYILYELRCFFARPSHVLRSYEQQARNQVMSHISSTMTGLTTIRTYQTGTIYSASFHRLLDDHTSVYFTQLCSSKMFCALIDLIAFGYIAATMATILFTFSPSEYNGPLIGLCLNSMFNLIGVAQWAWKRSIDSDVGFMSFCNLLLFDGLPNETLPHQRPSMTTGGEQIDWPVSLLELDFKNVSVNYKLDKDDDKLIQMINGMFAQDDHGNSIEDDKLALKNVSLTIGSNEKIGVCGRSGSGKSTLFNALLGFSHHQGQILINGKDLSEYSLKTVRQHVSIIPQFPVIFSGSIRDNLDLFHKHSDKQLWHVLEQVQLKEMVETYEQGLNQTITSESQLMSLGQKQLICLGRIMLQNNRLIILDEATANVDYQTDQLIQKTIREVFQDSTVFIIAHRLDSIIDCDRILVFDDGRLVEDGSPSQLISNRDGNFSLMVQQNTINNSSN